MQRFVSPGNETAREIKTTLDTSSSCFHFFAFVTLFAHGRLSTFYIVAPLFLALHPYQIYARLFPCKISDSFDLDGTRCGTGAVSFSVLVRSLFFIDISYALFKSALLTRRFLPVLVLSLAPIFP